jgi:hypothetical protein
MSEAVENRLLELLAARPHTARDLQQALTISQPTLSRLVQRLGSRVIMFGKGKSTCYGRPRSVRDAGHCFPVYHVGQDGHARPFGTLTAVWERHFWWQAAHGQSRMFRQLPWFIQDLRPDGFIGRALAHRYHQELAVPRRLQDWNDDDTLTAVARRGEECIGNLIVGTESLQRYLRLASTDSGTFQGSTVSDVYPQLARQALSGDPAGSSAGGEQPKFTVRVEKNGTVRHLLVKFSPVTSGAEGRRWADLLVCEHLALQVIRESGHPAAISSVSEFGDRMYLEVERFDRTGRTGRLPLVSLGVVDDEFFGHRDSWVAAAERLEAARMLSSEDVKSLRWLSLYGDLIANTDQHFGNVSLIPDNVTLSRFRLAPAYDMLPMLFRPRDGELVERRFLPPPPSVLPEWHSALQAAAIFWERAASDVRISTGFRSLCAQAQTSVADQLKAPRLIS